MKKNPPKGGFFAFGCFLGEGLRIGLCQELEGNLLVLYLYLYLYLCLLCQWFQS